MSSSTFTHPSLFMQAEPTRQLKLLADFVMESSTVLPNDIDRFEVRLAIYARTAGISMEQARENVRNTCGNMMSSNLVAFGLGV